MTTNQNNNLTKSRLAYLTLAGAAALAGSAANAQIIVTQVNESVGFQPGDLTSFTSSLPGVNQFRITAGFSSQPAHYPGYDRFARNIGFTGIGAMQARAYGFSIPGIGFVIVEGLQPSPAGVSFYNLKTQFGLAKDNHNFSAAPIHGVTASFNPATQNPAAPSSYIISSFGVGRFTDQYYGIKFKDSTTGKTDFGWIEASLTGTLYDNVAAPYGYPALSLNIIAYAYDASGATIKMGQTSVPEPGAAVALAAFSALTLGAAGVRRLKAMQAA